MVSNPTSMPCLQGLCGKVHAGLRCRWQLSFRACITVRLQPPVAASHGQGLIIIIHNGESLIMLKVMVPCGERLMVVLAGSWFGDRGRWWILWFLRWLSDYLWLITRSTAIGFQTITYQLTNSDNRLRAKHQSWSWLAIPSLVDLIGEGWMMVDNNCWSWLTNVN